MRVQEIKFKNLSDSYSILIGNNIINLLPKRSINYVLKQKRLH